jgi:hypothetical protein
VEGHAAVFGRWFPGGSWQRALFSTGENGKNSEKVPFFIDDFVKIPIIDLYEILP